MTDQLWINVMQEKPFQFERNKVWDLVPRLEDVNIVGTKWIYNNKSDENGNMTRNKERLVGQGYTQIEKVEFDETFSLLASLESIRLLLGISCMLKL